MFPELRAGRAGVQAAPDRPPPVAAKYQPLRGQGLRYPFPGYDTASRIFHYEHQKQTTDALSPGSLRLEVTRMQPTGALALPQTRLVMQPGSKAGLPLRHSRRAWPISGALSPRAASALRAVWLRVVLSVLCSVLQSTVGFPRVPGLLAPKCVLSLQIPHPLAQSPGVSQVPGTPTTPLGVSGRLRIGAPVSMADALYSRAGHLLSVGLHPGCSRSPIVGNR